MSCIVHVFADSKIFQITCFVECSGTEVHALECEEDLSFEFGWILMKTVIPTNKKKIKTNERSKENDKDH